MAFQRKKEGDFMLEEYFEYLKEEGCDTRLLEELVKEYPKEVRI